MAGQEGAVLVGAVGAAAVVFFLVVAVVAGLGLWFTGEKRALRRRLSAIDGYLARSGTVENWQAPPSLESGDKKSAGLGRFFARRTKAGLPTKFTQPGRGSSADMPPAAITTAAMAVGGAAVLGLMGGGSIVAALVGGLLGLLLPRVWRQRKLRARRKAFDAQIPDALALISNSLKAGYGLLQAMEMVGQEMHPPIAPEFVRTLAEIRVGASTEDALAALAARVGSEDMDLVVTAFLIQRQVGGNLAEVLDKIAFTIRERIRIRGEVRTLTAQGRLSGLIIGVLPLGIGLFLAAVNPEYVMTLFRHPLGQMMLVMAVGAEAVGVLFIKKIIAIDI